MSKLHIVLSSAVGALSGLVTTIFALLAFTVEDFGAFAFVYAVYALGWSICLSVLCDTFTRTRTSARRDSVWGEYSSALVGLVIVVTVIACIFSFFLYPDLLSATLASVAIGLNVYRSGARFYKVSQYGPGSVVMVDAWYLVVFATVFFWAESIGASHVTSHATAWIIAGISSLCTWPPVMSHPWKAVITWCRPRIDTIRTLLGDSIFMDFGAIVGPLFLLPILGTSAFGTYRGLSSVASPVQLLLDPIRPVLSQLPTIRKKSFKLLASVVGAGLLMSFACYAVLWSIGKYQLVSGALEELSMFALPCAIFVFTNFLGHFYYILIRATATSKDITFGRATQTLAATACPLLGAVVLGLPGAIWGFVAATAVSSMTWAALTLMSIPRARACQSIYSRDKTAKASKT